jgi:alcohol dehydrogenase YqhD (iron-dependent ADH family)
MINDTCYNPTAVYFGKGMEQKVGEEVAKYSRRILLLYGRGSFKRFGLYDRITSSLQAADVRFTELGGVKPNPSAELVYEGIDVCRRNKIDFVLAVGGGSVIDSAKAISIGVPSEGDFFDFFEGKRTPSSSLRVATVLTVPGSGSESNQGSVINHEEKHVKTPYAHPLMFPVFSILNPEITYSLSQYQTACGIVDSITHVLERYFTNTTFVDCTDRICEGLIKTLMKYAVLAQEAADDYDIRSEIMWACKLAHDNTAGFGRKQDWSSHKIAHELGALYDAPHGALMGVVILAWLKCVYPSNIDRSSQFAQRVFDIAVEQDSPHRAVTAAIGRYESFLKSLQMPTALRDLGITDKTCFQRVAENCVKPMPSGTIGNFARLSPEQIIKLLEIAY